MGSAKGPRAAIHQLLAEDLRRLICALPDELRESVPEKLKEETGLGKEDETDK